MASRSAGSTSSRFVIRMALAPIPSATFTKSTWSYSSVWEYRFP
jgi:hypothetical protein